MLPRDADNVGLVDSIESVDRTNARFYGRFQFPWAPMAFESPTDQYFETVMLNQSLGSWDQSAVGRSPNIWVAGCGTNQAVFTALRFPKGKILATDLSRESLEASARIARDLEVGNIEFRQESINKSESEEQFDYVICTGVIHHNADPQIPLGRLAAALKRTGVLELMVYNRYHRIETTAFQKAIRILGAPAGGDFESELAVAQRIVHAARGEGQMARFLENYKESPEARVADALLQPVEHTFTIGTLESLAAECGLELLAQCINQFDKGSRNVFWNMEFGDAGLQSVYDSLPDARRWEVTNYLMLDRSPMLWFYLQRKESGRPPKPERQLCEEFLERRFTRSEAKKRVYLRTDEGNYALNDQVWPYTGRHVDESCRRIVAIVGDRPRIPMRTAFEQLGIAPSFTNVNRSRLLLTTSAFPYLVACA